MRRAGLAAIVACAAALGVRAGDARACSPAIPTWPGTPDGTTIPRRGTLYALVSELVPLKEQTGAGVATRVLWTARGELTEVVALDYQASGAAIELGSDVGFWRLPVDDWWKPPAQPPRVIAIWHESDEVGGCGLGDVLALQLDQPVAAVRIRWRDGSGLIEHVVPPRAARKADPPSTVLVLGAIPYAETLDIARLHAGGALQLFAIRFDGSEVEIAEGIPAWVDIDDFPPTGRQRPLEVLAAAPPATPTPPPASSGGAPILWWLVIIAGTIAAIAVLGRIARSRPPLD